MEGVLAVGDQAFQLTVASGERVEHHACVVNHGPHRALLRGQHLDQLVAVFGERLQVREPGVDLFAASVDAFRERLLPDLEGTARLRIEGRQDAVERHRRFDLAVRQLGTVREVGRRAALGDQLHVGLSQERLLAQDRVHIRAHRRVAVADFERRVGAPVAAVLQRHDMPHVHAADAYVGLFGQRQPARERDRHLVALRFQRHGSAEGLPQEQQQPEAAQAEQDDHDHVAQRGSALLHSSSRPLPIRQGTASPRRRRTRAGAGRPASRPPARAPARVRAPRCRRA